ncbi:hypothetical protein [Undibacterium sp. TJN19]|uniref:hypothetical protein n=1 Tax=Undibacterium sp. TJN19 TaxID=3413055 RepID=UPI003BF2F078
MKLPLLFPALAAIILVATLSTAHAETHNAPNADDEKQINTLLTNYTTSVTNGDSALFESQLLDLHIPFSGVSQKKGGAAKMTLQSIQNYQGFKAAIFGDSQQYKQRFSAIDIQQVGNLAQVSLDYETAGQGEDYQGKGWKIIQLIKVDGNWKIASEFFAGYPRS